MVAPLSLLAWLACARLSSSTLIISGVQGRASKEEEASELHSAGQQELGRLSFLPLLSSASEGFVPAAKEVRPSYKHLTAAKHDGKRGRRLCEGSSCLQSSSTVAVPPAPPKVDEEKRTGGGGDGLRVLKKDECESAIQNWKEYIDLVWEEYGDEKFVRRENEGLRELERWAGVMDLQGFKNFKALGWYKRAKLMSVACARIEKRDRSGPVILRIEKLLLAPSVENESERLEGARELVMSVVELAKENEMQCDLSALKESGMSGESWMLRLFLEASVVGLDGSSRDSSSSTPPGDSGGRQGGRIRDPVPFPPASNQRERSYSQFSSSSLYSILEYPSPDPRPSLIAPPGGVRPSAEEVLERLRQERLRRQPPPMTSFEALEEGGEGDEEGELYAFTGSLGDEEGEIEWEGVGANGEIESTQSFVDEQEKSLEEEEQDVEWKRRLQPVFVLDGHFDDVGPYWYASELSDGTLFFFRKRFRMENEFEILFDDPCDLENTRRTLGSCTSGGALVVSLPPSATEEEGEGEESERIQSSTKSSEVSEGTEGKEVEVEEPAEREPLPLIDAGAFRERMRAVASALNRQRYPDGSLPVSALLQPFPETAMALATAHATAMAAAAAKEEGISPAHPPSRRKSSGEGGQERRKEGRGLLKERFSDAASVSLSPGVLSTALRVSGVLRERLDRDRKTFIQEAAAAAAAAGGEGSRRMSPKKEEEEGGLWEGSDKNVE
uniref:HTH La-type RNA-binding domain-containing protein n=1 Tax=Chromera velia CCMP2878 TaxID=1169474 RepID=A0A0G4FZW9_9ALVE|eukprot:Cvel_516.t1-p1 / transcript=Cvel_516.t1 / gene=Cvel_516 / organism=Chromera_velia_CCMP2878 / gene_product=hypothetical protein / transcript_product=hypothetical protein / location=Cvel_scaffold16:67510-70070(-) / protein_length=726 / sequence_SO=supercontig / SO=protein_coding / is_pseudo=false